MNPNLDEIIQYLTELLYMTRNLLIKEADFKHHSGKQTKNQIIIYCLEKKFNPKIKDPTVENALNSSKNKPWRLKN